MKRALPGKFGFTMGSIVRLCYTDIRMKLLARTCSGVWHSVWKGSTSFGSSKVVVACRANGPGRVAEVQLRDFSAILAELRRRRTKEAAPQNRSGGKALNLEKRDRVEEGSGVQLSEEGFLPLPR